MTDILIRIGLGLLATILLLSAFYFAKAYLTKSWRIHAMERSDVWITGKCEDGVYVLEANGKPKIEPVEKYNKVSFSSNVIAERGLPTRKVFFLNTDDSIYMAVDGLSLRDSLFSIFFTYFFLLAGLAATTATLTTFSISGVDTDSFKAVFLWFWNDYGIRYFFHTFSVILVLVAALNLYYKSVWQTPSADSYQVSAKRDITVGDKLSGVILNNYTTTSYYSSTTASQSRVTTHTHMCVEIKDAYNIPIVLDINIDEELAKNESAYESGKNVMLDVEDFFVVTWDGKSN